MRHLSRRWTTALMVAVAFLAVSPAAAASASIPSSLHSAPSSLLGTHPASILSVHPAGVEYAGIGHAYAAPHPQIATTPVWYNVTPALIAVNQTFRVSTQAPGLYGEAMASVPTGSGYNYDVVYGGYLPNGALSNQTWIFEPPFGISSWYNATAASAAPVSPPALAFASLVYDPRIPAVVLFGGYLGGLADSNQTWFLNTTSGTWSNQSAVACSFFCPAVRDHGSMVFAADPVDNSTILFGGCNGAFCFSQLNDTWNLTNFGGGFFVWVPGPASGAPPARYGAMMAYGGNGVGNVTWLFGGCYGFIVGNCGMNDTWEYWNSTWYNDTAVVNFFGPTPTGRNSAVLGYDWGHQDLLMTGGENNTGSLLTDTWTFACQIFCTWTNDTAAAGGVPVFEGAISSDSTFGEPTVYGGLYAGAAHGSNSTWVFQNFTQFRATAGSFAPEVNQSDAFNATFITGPPYDGQTSIWTFTPPVGAPFQVPFNNSQLFSQNGTYLVSVMVFDGWGVSQVYVGGISVGIPTVTPSASRLVTDVGVADHYSETVGGVHTGALSYAWTFGDGGTAATASADHTFTHPGVFDAKVTLTDQYTMVNSTLSVTVHATPSVTVTGSPTLSGSVSSGQNVTFTAHVANGTPGYTYAWSFGDGSASSTVAGPVHSYAAMGNYTVNLTITDAVGVTNVTHVVVHVLAAAIPLSATASSNVSTAKTGAAIQFTALGSGGTGPYTYAWHFGDGGSATTATASHSYTTAATFSATVWVNDSAGHSVTKSLSVIVTSNGGSSGNNGGSTSSSSSGIPTWAWAVVAVLVIAGILGAVLYMRRRGGQPPPSPTPPPADTGSPGAAPGSTPPPGSAGGPPTG
ncbi:MAG: PKD domain-containing protein [Thermoplasmata archaeon]|nr:PKD domain-containing protein [Thermoplasmata archaeon]